MKNKFAKIAQKTTELAGNPFITIAAFIAVLAWILGGFFIGFTDTYQLIINTGTTIITF